MTRELHAAHWKRRNTQRRAHHLGLLTLVPLVLFASASGSLPLSSEDHLVAQVSEAFELLRSDFTHLRVSGAETLYIYSRLHADDMRKIATPPNFFQHTGEGIKVLFEKENEFWVRYFLLKSLASVASQK